MKILSITAQKPNGTGSGIYLSELIKGFEEFGYEQAVVAGIYESDHVELPDRVKLFPVFFLSEELPFPIPGMSDEMPYKSSVYGEMTVEMVKRFRHVFIRTIRNAVECFEPDVILCHHLFLLTALVREYFPDTKVIAVSHGTDIRQMKKISLEQTYIREQIQKLDHILALHESQKAEIQKIYGISMEEKITVVGTGYNSHIFYRQNSNHLTKQRTILYAGKLSEKKGVMSLIRCLNYLSYEEQSLCLKLAGGYHNEKEYKEICRLMNECKYPIVLLGTLSQENLAKEFNSSDLFVLPSFSEGLPLVILEALACGVKVVATDLPGVQEWMNERIEHHGIHFVEPPAMIYADEPEEVELPKFERRLAKKIEEGLEDYTISSLNLEHLSWRGVCEKITKILKLVS